MCSKEIGKDRCLLEEMYKVKFDLDIDEFELLFEDDSLFFLGKRKYNDKDVLEKLFVNFFIDSMGVDNDLMVGMELD